jgi:hypothetical protein
MPPAPAHSPCSTISFVSALETSKNLVPPRLDPQMLDAHISANGCGASARDKLEERKRLVRTAPTVPYSPEEGWRDGPSKQLPRLPACRLRMRPSKEDAASTTTPTLKVSFVPVAGPTGKQQASEVAGQALLPSLPSSLPSCLSFPDIPSSPIGGHMRKFILKPKPLPRSFQPAGKSH